MGHFVKIAANHEVISLLGEDGSCVTGGPDYDSCLFAQLRQLSLDSVGCTTPWIPDKSNICKDAEKRTEAFDVYQKNRRKQNYICPNSCLFSNLYFSPPVTGENNVEKSHLGEAILYFRLVEIKLLLGYACLSMFFITFLRRDIKTTSEYYLYSGLSMVAEIGGYVGLLLGVSLFKLAQVNNMLIDKFRGNYSSQLGGKWTEASGKGQGGPTKK